MRMAFENGFNFSEQDQDCKASQEAKCNLTEISNAVHYEGMEEKQGPQQKGIAFIDSRLYNDSKQ